MAANYRQKRADAAPTRFQQRVLTECGHHIGKDVLDLVPHGQKNHDDDDRNENQDQGILDHSLAALANGTPTIHDLQPPFSLPRERFETVTCLTLEFSFH
jgi:hypothetical protein